MSKGLTLAATYHDDMSLEMWLDSSAQPYDRLYSDGAGRFRLSGMATQRKLVSSSFMSVEASLKVDGVARWKGLVLRRPDRDAAPWRLGRLPELWASRHRGGG